MTWPPVAIWRQPDTGRRCVSNQLGTPRHAAEETTSTIAFAKTHLSVPFDTTRCHDENIYTGTQTPEESDGTRIRDLVENSRLLRAYRTEGRTPARLSHENMQRKG